MSMHFQWYEVVGLMVLFAGHFWWAVLFAALAFGMIAYVSRGGWRRTFAVFAWILLGYQVIWWAVAGGMTLKGKYSDVQYERQRKRLLVVQKEAQTVQGLLLPVGARVQWNDEAHTSFESVDLPGPTQELGVPLTGFVKNLAGADAPEWKVTLAQDAMVQQWPCSAADPVTLDAKGAPMLCTLSGPRKVHDFTVPAGTHYKWDHPGDNLYSLELTPPPGASIALPSVGVTVPAGYTLQLHADLKPREIMANYDASANGQQVLQFRGLPVDGTFEIYYGHDFSGDQETTKPPTAVHTYVLGKLACGGHELTGNDFVFSLKDSMVQRGDDGSGNPEPVYPFHTCRFKPNE